MSYEFVEPGDKPEGATSPDYWRNEPKKIYNMWPYVPTPVSPFSVIHDPETGQIALDTNDILPEVFSATMKPVWIMRVMTVENDAEVDGFLIDMRGKRLLTDRPIDFDNPDEQMAEYKTARILGAVFAHPEGKLEFRSDQYDLLLPYAASMLEAIDAARSSHVAEKEKEPAAEKQSTNIDRPVTE